jgi:hypothetical protein
MAHCGSMSEVLDSVSEAMQDRFVGIAAID